MANGDASFPKISVSSWWKLRELFRNKVPAIVTPSYLASALSMEESSAKSNVIGPFKKIGIIGDDGKPTDLAYDWRDDHKYHQVCTSLIESCYPQELKDLFHTPDANLQKLTSWFMNSARCGEPAAKHFARFYLLLLKADPNEIEIKAVKKESSKKSAVAPQKAAVKKATKPPAIAPSGIAHTEPSTTTPATTAQHQPVKTILNNSPELHINVQLHISPESSADQIDKIFASMAKHLKDFNK